MIDSIFNFTLLCHQKSANLFGKFIVLGAGVSNGKGNSGGDHLAQQTSNTSLPMTEVAAFIGGGFVLLAVIVAVIGCLAYRRTSKPAQKVTKVNENSRNVQMPEPSTVSAAEVDDEEEKTISILDLSTIQTSFMKTAWNQDSEYRKKNRILHIVSKRI